MSITPIYRDEYKNIKIKHQVDTLVKRIISTRLNKENIKYMGNDYLAKDYIINNCTMVTLWNAACVLPDSSKVLEIGEQVRSGKLSNIVLITDFDADGLSSAVVLEKSLSIINPNLVVHTIYNKRIYGTGVTQYCLDKLFSIDKVDLIILADHGSSNGEEYDIILERLHNVKIILTDHHQVDYTSMDPVNKHTFPFVNAHRTDIECGSELIDKEILRSLSGCCVAYLTMLLLAGHDKYKDLEPLLYLVALSTISDVMPLDNPVNRFIVRTGFNYMYSQWPELMNNILKTNKLLPKDLSFGIIPIINTGNRTNNEDLSYRVIKKDDGAIEELEKINRSRKYETRKIVNNLLYTRDKIEYPHSVIGISDSSYSIAGNIAGNIGETLNKPTVIFNKSNTSSLSGSIRGILNGLDVVKVLRDIENEDKSILIRYGGHKQAAGCSIHIDKLDNFISLFDKYVNNQTKDLDTTKYLYVDSYIHSDDIDIGLFKSTEKAGPYGKNWEDPIYFSKLRISNIIPIGSMSKVIFKSKSGIAIEGFSLVSKESIEEYLGETMYVFYSLEISNRVSGGSLELRIHHMDKDCNLQQISYLRS